MDKRKILDSTTEENFSLINFLNELRDFVIAFVGEDCFELSDEERSLRIEQSYNTVIKSINDPFCNLSLSFAKNNWVYLNRYFYDHIEFDKIPTINEKIKTKSPEELNEFIVSVFTDEAFSDMILIVKNFLEDFNVKKIDLAVEHYRNKHYYDCASLLFKIIESHTNLMLHHKKPDMRLYGYAAWAELYNLSDKKPFKDELNTKNKKEYAENLKALLSDENTLITLDIENKVHAASLVIILNNIYGDYKLGDDRPELNRNCMMHGYYEVSDFNQTKCLKLFFILFQMIEFYSELGLYEDRKTIDDVANFITMDNLGIDLL